MNALTLVALAFFLVVGISFLLKPRKTEESTAPVSPDSSGDASQAAAVGAALSLSLGDQTPTHQSPPE